MFLRAPHEGRASVSEVGMIDLDIVKGVFPLHEACAYRTVVFAKASVRTH